MRNEKWYRNKKLSVVFLAAVIAVFFAATAFGAGNMYLINNTRVYPNLVVAGQTQPVIPLDNANWVQEEVFIEIPVDFDQDGLRDLCCFQYGIPVTAVSSDNILSKPLLLCPTIMRVSPYAGLSVNSAYYSAFDYTYMEPRVDGPWPGENNPDTTNWTYKDVENIRARYKDILAANFNPDWLPPMRTTMFEERRGTNRGTTGPNSPSAWFNYFRARGYAYGTMFSIGTSRSEGYCANKPYDEALVGAAVVDWLNGRGVKAYRYPYKVRIATASEIATHTSWNNNLDNNTATGDRILDGKYIRDDVNGGWVECKAYWATGDAAMAGQSYDGAMPLMAMTTGVEGLRCVVPFASVAGSYEYYRDNGSVVAPVACQGEDVPMYFAYCGARMYNPTSTSAITRPDQYGDKFNLIWSNFYKLSSEATEKVERATGNYTSYYDNRNLLKYVPDARAGGVVILWHGFNDLNVKFKNGALWYEAWKKAPGVTVKSVFHLMKHASPWNQEGFNFFPRIHGVLDKLMYGLDNTALEDWPNVIIHNNETLEFEEFSSWPINDRVQRFYPTGDSRVSTLSINKPKQTAKLDVLEVKSLTLTRPAVSVNPSTGAVSAPQMNISQYTTWKHNIIGGSDTALTNADPFNILPNQDRLIYLVDISEDTRISGHIKMTARVASDKKIGGISAMLVDMGEAQHVHQTFTTQGTMGSTVNTGNSVMYYPGTSVDLLRLQKVATSYPWNIIARGHVGVQKVNTSGKTSIDCPEDNFIAPFYYQTTVIEPGKFYPYTWALHVMDYTILAGHKLALILYSTDPEYIQRPFEPTKLTFEIGPDTYLQLPLVGEFVTKEVPDPAGPVNPADVLVGGTAPTGAAIANNMLVWNGLIVDEGIILNNSLLDGYTIEAITPAGTGAGYTLTLDGDKVIVTFDSQDVVDGIAEIYLKLTGRTTGYDELLLVKFSGHASEEPGNGGSGSSGCNAGFAFIALIAPLVFVARRRK